MNCAAWAALRGWLAVLLFFPLSGWAQQPQFQLITPDASVYPQYFSVGQGSDRMLYVGFAGGVLRFDGARWATIPVPGTGAVRQVHRDRNGRVWVGAASSFGYLKRDANGSDRYVEVSSRFGDRLDDPHFADIWTVLERDDGLYFRALRHVFHVGFSGEALNLWQHDGRFGGIGEVRGELWLQWRGVGLKRLVDGRFEAIPGGEAFASALVYNLLELPDGRAVVHSLTPRLAIWDGQRFDDRPALVADPAFDHLGQGMVLDDGQIVFSGDDGILRFVSVDQQKIQAVPIVRSYISEVVRDLDGALLAISDDGVARLPWPPALLLFDERAGFRGGLNGLRIVDDSLYLLGASGVYRGRMAEADPVLPLRRLEWTGDEAWDLMVDGDGLLLADSRSLRRVLSGEVEQVAADDLYPRSLLTDSRDPQRMWVGTEQGVSLLQRSSAGWEALGENGHAGLAVSSLFQRDANSVWVGTVGQGLMVAEWSSASASLRLRPLNESEGGPIADGMPVQLSRAGGQLWASTTGSLYRLDGTAFVAEAPDGLDAVRPAAEMVELADDGSGGLWATSYRAIYHGDPQGRWRVTGLAGLRRGSFTASVVLPDGDLLLGGAGTLLRAERDAMSVDSEGLTPLVVSASLGGRGEGVEPQPFALDQPVAFTQGDGNLDVDFALPDISSVGSAAFSSRLTGLEDAWSEWSDRTSISYAAIPPGEYRLELRARGADGRVSTAAPLSIRVAPRWYQRADVQLLAVLALLLLLACWLQWRSRHRLAWLYQHNQELDALVRERTQDLEAANVRLRSQAERDGLTGVGNRSYFDGRLATACTTATRTGSPLALLMIDVDHFKPYNDQYGHLAGDDALRRLAAILTADVRESTLVARYGGEEFVLVAERCTAEAAVSLAGRLVADVAADALPLTISVGVAVYDVARDPDPESLVRRADEALYAAKRQGRNRVVAYDPMMSGEAATPDATSPT